MNDGTCAQVVNTQSSRIVHCLSFQEAWRTFIEAKAGARSCFGILNVTRPRLSSGVLAGVLGLSLVAAAELGALAQGSGRGPDPLAPAFQDMMQDLSDPTRSFRYAQAAIQAGAVPEAVSALERILLRDPGLDNIRLELGILYVSLGNTALGDAYIEAALRNPNTPIAVRERADRILRDARKASSPHQFSGSAFVGLRYDTNVTSAPGSPTVLLFGLTTPSASDGGTTDDASLAALFVGRYTYDFGQQNFNRLEVNGFANGQLMFKQSNYDIGVLGGDIGPWLALPYGDPGSTEIRPFLSGYNFVYGGDQYLASGGGGLSLRHALNASWIATTTVQAGLQTYTNSAFRPTSTQQSGPEYRISGGLQYKVAAKQFANLDLGYARKEANFSYYSYDQFSVAAGYSIEYDDPTGWFNRPWSSGISAVYRYYNYDAPDPLVSSTLIRRDQRYEAAFTQLIGLVGTTSLQLRVDYVKTDSNAPNYEFDNFTVMGGIQTTF